MPTYQYACTECGHQLEAVQSFTDEPLTECPVCSGRLRKRFSSVGVVFKGSGFYRNDSRDSASGGAAAKDGSAKNGSGASGSDSGSGKNGSSGETKSESKTDSKTDSKPAAPASTSSTSST